MEFSQVFNITYIFIGLLLVSYFWVVGNATKKYAKFVKLPSIVTGFFKTMLIWSPLFLFTHITDGIDYKVWYIAYMILTTVSALCLLKIEDIKKIKLSSIIIVISIWFTTMLYSFIFNEGKAMINEDYWLYGQWMSDASNFVSSAIHVESTSYFYSVFYRFFGSFIGMFESIPQIDIEQVSNAKAFIPVIQTTLSLSMITIGFNLFTYTVKKINPFTLGLFILIIVLSEPYKNVLVGSHLLWVITTIAIVDMVRGEDDERVIGILIGTMLYFTSSVILISIPLLIIYRMKLNKNHNFINSASIFILIKFTIVNYIKGDSILFYLIPSVLLIIYTFTNKYFDKPIQRAINFIERHPMKILFVSGLLIFGFNIYNQNLFSLGLVVILLLRQAGLILIVAAGYVFYKKEKTTVFVYILLVTALFANPITYEFLKFIGDDRFNSIIHRFLQNALIGEKYNYAGLAIIAPWLLSEIIDTKAT